MISLKEFLSSQEERLKAEQVTRTQALERWTASVLSLLEQIEQWIEDSDPHKLVAMNHVFAETHASPADTHIGARLDIWLGNQGISIRPARREVVGPRWKPGEEWH